MSGRADPEPHRQQRVRDAARRRERAGLGILARLSGRRKPDLQRVLDHLEGPSFTAYFVYPEELKTSKRVSVFPRFPARESGRAAVW